MSQSNLTRDDVLNFLRKNKDFLKKEFKVDNIILFGSYARNEATDQSDIDILLEAKEKDFDKRFDLKELLEKQFKRKVDIAYIDAVRPLIMHFIKEELIYA